MILEESNEEFRNYDNPTNTMYTNSAGINNKTKQTTENKQNLSTPKNPNTQQKSSKLETTDMHQRTTKKLHNQNDKQNNQHKPQPE